MDILLIGGWWGNLESTSLTFWFQPVWGLHTCEHHTLSWKTIEVITDSPSSCAHLMFLLVSFWIYVILQASATWTWAGHKVRRSEGWNRAKGKLVTRVLWEESVFGRKVAWESSILEPWKLFICHHPWLLVIKAGKKPMLERVRMTCRFLTGALQFQYVHQTESPLNRIILGFLWRHHHVGIINY